MWKDVKGYEGLYQVNENGEVKSLSRLKGSIICKERMLKQEKIYSGYYRVSLCKNDKVKRFAIHRLVYENFIGELKDGYTIHHIDEDKSNNHVNNLLQCSQRENNHFSRESIGYKLFEEDVNYIRENKLTVKQIVEKYNISKRHALRIIKNERWVM